MHQRKSKKIIIYFFILILISSTNNISINRFNLNKIKDIKIIGLNNNENKLLLKELKNIKLENIFFINGSAINDLINSKAIIENFEVKKKYPSSIEIKINKTKFLAKINKGGKILTVGSNGKLLSNKINNTNLPFIFGNPEIKEFLIFKKILEKSNFSYQQVENFYFFPSKRWDLKLKNNILLKLPNDQTLEALNYAYKFLDDFKKEKFTVVDVRIENQIILNE